jgi:hypothetical protein
MPLKKCTSDGKSGFKWGNSGKCFTGPNAKEQATKQGQAIEISKRSKGTNTEPPSEDEDERGDRSKKKGARRGEPAKATLWERIHQSLSNALKK